ncbi:hypothetical protein LOD99_11563 [Oopsacas minuta]|uniref:TACO1/YebC-like N-terminal domain-containing protein n=1 Tax=Oopsacas minuta TaxID=111878 RepID=A0AAV7JLA0_9METZ|nr:hypothetical protein LOD99_11563 [Oopsacas minuta]
MAERNCLRSLENVPKGLATKISNLNDYLTERNVRILSYLYNEENRDCVDISTNFLEILSNQENINCHLLIRFLRVSCLDKLAGQIEDELGTNREFLESDHEAMQDVEASLNDTDGTLSIRCLKFRELLVEILREEMFTPDDNLELRSMYNLSPVKDKQCKTLLEVVLYDELSRTKITDVCDILQVFLFNNGKVKAVLQTGTYSKLTQHKVVIKFQLNETQLRFAGHNKWSKIARKKLVADMQRSNMISRHVTRIRKHVAKNGNSEQHPELIDLMDRGKELQIPKATLERALTISLAKSFKEHKVILRGPSNYLVLVCIYGSPSIINQSRSELKKISRKHSLTILQAGSDSSFFLEKGLYQYFPFG